MVLDARAVGAPVLCPAMMRSYLTPDAPGLRGRQIALATLHLYVIVAALVALSLDFVEHRRRKRRWWFIKIVEQSTGRILIGNQIVLFAITAVLLSTLYIIRIAYEYRATTNMGGCDLIYFWRYAPSSLYALASWVLCWTAAQSFVSVLMASNRGALPWWRQSIANIILGGLGIIAFGMAFVSWIVGAVRWDHASVVAGTYTTFTNTHSTSDPQSLALLDELSYGIAGALSARQIILASRLVTELITTLLIMSSLFGVLLIQRSYRRFPQPLTAHIYPRLRTEKPDNGDIDFSLQFLEQTIGVAEREARDVLLRKVSGKLVLIGLFVATLATISGAIVIWYLTSDAVRGWSDQVLVLRIWFHLWLYGVAFSILLTILNFTTLLRIRREPVAKVPSSSLVH